MSQDFAIKKLNHASRFVALTQAVKDALSEWAVEAAEIRAAALTYVDDDFDTVDGFKHLTGDIFRDGLFEADYTGVKVAVSGGSGSFTPGEVVTQSTSGTTGIFIEEENGFMELTGVINPMTTPGPLTLTGGTSGATRTGTVVSKSLVNFSLSGTASNTMALIKG